MLSYNRKEVDVLLAKTRSPVIADDNVIHNFKTIIFKHERTRPNCRHSLITHKNGSSHIIDFNCKHEAQLSL